MIALKFHRKDGRRQVQRTASRWPVGWRSLPRKHYYIHPITKTILRRDTKEAQVSIINQDTWKRYAKQNEARARRQMSWWKKVALFLKQTWKYTVLGLVRPKPHKDYFCGELRDAPDYDPSGLHV